MTILRDNVPDSCPCFNPSLVHFTFHMQFVKSRFTLISRVTLIVDYERERERERKRDINFESSSKLDRIVGKRVKKIQRLVYQLTRDPRVGLSKINGSISFRERCNFFSFFSFLSFALTRAYLLERDDFSGILLINEGRERSSLMIISFRVCSNWNFFFRWHREGGIRTIVEFQRYSYTRSNLNKKGKSYKFNL